MSFRTISSQQISWNDNLRILTDRERKVLDHSWAKAFAEDVFPISETVPIQNKYGLPRSKCGSDSGSKSGKSREHR